MTETTETSEAASARTRSLKRVARAIVVIVPLLVVGVPVLCGVITTGGLLYVPCSESGDTPADYGHTFEDVTLDASDGGSFLGYFIPGTNGAAIIIPPPLASGRGNRMNEADVLARSGYAVLLFESRRCAGMGAHSLGYQEISEVGDVLAYLQERNDVRQIGVLGFSSAGATAVMAAARYPALAAVIAEGGYGDFPSLSVAGDSANVLEVIYKWVMRTTYRVITGESIDRLRPVDVIGDIAPRPILLIYGSTERSLSGAYDQLAAAGDNAALWVVEGAGHGNYVDVAPQEYERRVIAFLDRALLE
jgi:uncharacterized protein